MKFTRNYLRNYDLEHYYFKMCEIYKEYLQPPYGTYYIGFDGTRIEIIALKNGNIFLDILKDNNWENELYIIEHAVDREKNIANIYIEKRKRKDEEIVTNIYNKLFPIYFDKVDDIYMIDNTGFLIKTNNIDIIGNILLLDEISLLTYTKINDDRHVFTL